MLIYIKAINRANTANTMSYLLEPFLTEVIKGNMIYKTKTLSHTTIQVNLPCGSRNKEICNGENRGPVF